MDLRPQTEANEWFEDLYRKSPDPWRFATSEYEQAKFAHTLEALPRARYHRALDVGCSIGVITQMLAPRCDYVLGIDGAEGCMEEARKRCAPYPHVEIARMFVPGQWPEGQFDLILFSEIVCYLGAADVVKLADRVKTSLAPGGTVEFVTWHGEKLDAIDLLIQLLGETADVKHSERRPLYRLDVLVRR